MASPVSADPIDRALFVARSGRPHCQPIAHLTQTHSLPATASYLLEAATQGRPDPDLARILTALRSHRDADPASPTHGCYKWYTEDETICDTNASFFIGSPLAGLWLAQRGALSATEAEALRGVFVDVLPWFQRMAANPSLFYPNKCISDAAMLLATGHILGDPGVIAAGRTLAGRYFDYYARRGTGWGEDHSPVYTTVILEMTLLIMALEPRGELHDQARHLTDAILDWVAFHDGCDAVPSIRGYNFAACIRVPYRGAALIAGGAPENAPPPLALLAGLSGYRFAKPRLEVPRQRRWRTFDEHFSTSYIGPTSRLGTLSYYPLMPNGYMHDSWGLGWQSKPAAFMVGEEEYGILEWLSEDAEGVVRQHEAGAGFHDWASRHLLKRLSFHPEVVLVSHQEGGAAIILRELHRVHSPTRRLIDRWRLAKAAGTILVNGVAWDGQPADVAPGWIVLRYAHACVAIHPLTCRVPDAPDADPNPQRRTAGSTRAVPLRLERNGHGTLLSLPLVENHSGVLTAHLLFSGWCVVLLDRPEDVARLAVTESFHEDGEIPRTYGELIRTVELATPEVRLTLVRDPLAGTVRRSLDGREVSFVKRAPHP
jgi:hypothetical protein